MVYKAMLAHPYEFEEKSFQHFLNNNDWVVEEKLDGHRLLTYLDRGNIHVFNRDGEISQHYERLSKLPSWNHVAVRLKDISCVLDGELLDNSHYVVFDCPLVRFHVPYEATVVKASNPWQERRKHLLRLFNLGPIDFPDHFSVIQTAYSMKQKIELIHYCVTTPAEGIVIKNIESPYAPGERSAKMLKMKITHTADLMVVERHTDGKNNATVAARQGDGFVVVGSCSLVGKEEIEVGDIVEVRYLRLSENDRLVQPHIIRKRVDKNDVDALDDLRVPMKVAPSIVSIMKE